MGKVIGQVGAIFTQIFLLVSMAGLVIRFTSDSLPFSLANVSIEPTQIILAIVYLIFGFLILAFTMVGVGAAMPTYREASSFSSVFILLSIFPMYFFMMVLAEPTGLLSIVTSYFPYTAPMVLLLRNSLNALSPVEIAISIVTLIIDIFVIAFLSYRLFEFGALEYNQKISFKSFVNTFKRK
jgi:ABC-2 type transport system permease protein